MACVFCLEDGGEVLWRDAQVRVVLAGERDYPGFCRVIWNAHAREMTDLTPSERAHCMRAVFAVEDALRAIMRPHKMNLASLGNQVQHVHWHVIPRFEDDPHFPNPIWATTVREPAPRRLSPLAETLRTELSARLAAH
jgi:diadenosine tetraphosphate (Ap4A) HIT family hydrolase